MDQNTDNSLTNPIDQALADIHAASPTQPVEQQVTPAQPQPTVAPQQPQQTPNYGTTDFSTVNNSAPSPVSNSAPVVAAQPTPLEAQPKPEPMPNAYPTNQQVYPAGATSPTVQPVVPAQPMTMQQPAPQPATQPIMPQQIPAAPNTMSAAPAQQQTAAPIHVAPNSNGQQTIPQPGTPMSMGGVQQPNTPSGVSNAHHVGFTAYWPAMVGGSIIIVSMLIYLIVFL